jgi:hypothetical protein
MGRRGCFLGDRVNRIPSLPKDADGIRLDLEGGRSAALITMATIPFIPRREANIRRRPTFRPIWK